MKRFVLAAVAALLVFSGMAQDGRNDNKSTLAVSLGAALNYYYGPGDKNFGKFDDDFVNWQANAMVGIVLARNENNRRTMIAGFGSLGFNNDNTVEQIFRDQSYVTTALNQDQSNNFYQLEGGLVIADVLRVSTGVGQQNFAGQLIASTSGIQFNAKSLKYNSSTVGFQYKVGLASLIISCNFNYGKDYNKTVLNPSAGVMLNL